MAHVELIVTDIRRGEHTVTVTGINQHGKEETTHLKPGWYAENPFKVGDIVEYDRPTYMDWALSDEYEYDHAALEDHIKRLIEENGYGSD